MSDPNRPTPEWIMRFARAVAPDAPDLLLSTNEENILTAAADKIGHLEAENSRLRDVLEKIADGQDGTGWRIHSTGYAENVQRMAREALYEKV